MSINSSVQQISMGLAAWLSGKIVYETGDHMFRFGVVGLLSVCFGFVAIYFVRYLRSVGAATTTATAFAAET